MLIIQVLKYITQPINPREKKEEEEEEERERETKTHPRRTNNVDLFGFNGFNILVGDRLGVDLLFLIICHFIIIY